MNLGGVQIDGFNSWFSNSDATLVRYPNPGASFGTRTETKALLFLALLAPILRPTLKMTVLSQNSYWQSCYS